MPRSPTDPARDLAAAYRACSPRPLPADHPWYVDLSRAREGSLRPVLARRFRLKPGPEEGGREAWPKVLFLGMRGTGKSTELNALAAALRDRFEVVHMEADGRLNTEEFDLTELLLALAVEVEAHFRAHLHRPLDETLLEKLRSWFSVVTEERVAQRERVVEASGGAGLPRAAGFFASVMGLLRTSSEERRRVVAALRRYPAELVDLCNALLDAAGEVLAEDGRELLIIVDNLDRYAGAVVEQALEGGSDQLGALRVGMVLTPPLELLIRPERQPLSTPYAIEVMHVPAIRRPADPPGTLRDPGAGLLRELLSRRLDLAAVVEGEPVIDELLRLSGGHPRLLLELTREAIIREEDGRERLGLAAVEEAVRARLSILRDQVNVSGLVPLLARVHHARQLDPEPGLMRLLQNRWVFKHDGEDWYALNPLVARVPEVRAAIAGAEGR